MQTKLLGGTFFDISSLACFNDSDFYFHFQLAVLSFTGQSMIAFSSCEHLEAMSICQNLRSFPKVRT